MSFFENYNDLTGSLSDLTTINSLVSGSSYEYPNLNIDYNDFENHIFFGSAVKKLENFKTKVERIESYYTQISSSLSGSNPSPITTGSDASATITYRELYFDKIQDEIKTFTPYERFLYFDGQSATTASAPGIGKNYANSHALNKPHTLAFHNSRDGFKSVYEMGNSDPTGKTYITTNQYRAEQKPFFGYSGSVYFSFIVKSGKGKGLFQNTSFNNKLTNVHDWTSYNGIRTPKDAITKNYISRPIITGSEWRRYIFEANSSYWIPSEQTATALSTEDNSLIPWDVGSMWQEGDTDWVQNTTTDGFSNLEDSNQYVVLSGSMKTGSNSAGSQVSHQSSSGETVYRHVGDGIQITVPDTYQYLTTVITQSGAPFVGSVMPSGDLFRVRWGNSDTVTQTEVTSSWITDVKITLNDPTDVQPFAKLYKTTSEKWTTWYNSQYNKAKDYDRENINSLENNLPSYLRENSENDKLILFTHMMGEHWDLIRSYIDNYSTFYKRQYNRIDSVPTNL